MFPHLAAKRGIELFQRHDEDLIRNGRPDVDAKFIEAVQAYVARASLGASTVRGRGNAGAGKAGRKVLAPLDLSLFRTDDAERFERNLDEVTNAVRCARRPLLTWGLARKCVNIFLREALYNRYLCTQYGLERGEHLFEVPMDRLAAEELRAKSAQPVPRWRGVGKLTAGMNVEYQRAAEALARAQGLSARVHLDAFVWGRPEETAGRRRQLAVGRSVRRR